MVHIYTHFHTHVMLSTAMVHTNTATAILLSHHRKKQHRVAAPLEQQTALLGPPVAGPVQTACEGHSLPELSCATYSSGLRAHHKCVS